MTQKQTREDHSMPSRWSVVGLLVLYGVWVAATPVWATMENFKSIKQTYPSKDAKTYGCKTCHAGAIGKKGELNAYGKALNALKEKVVDPNENVENGGYTAHAIWLDITRKF